MPRRETSPNRRPPQDPPGLADLLLQFRTVASERLDEALRLRLPEGVSRSRVRSWILAGSVRVQGSPMRNPAWVLAPGVWVDLHVKRPAPQAVPEFGPDRILFEDEDLLVVDKPAGLPMHANLDPARSHLVGLLEAFLARRDGQAGYLGIHQRLDMETSGVVLLARSLRANPGLARQFEGRLLRKSYLALVRTAGKGPPASWLEARPLGAPLRRGGAVPILESGGSAARTEFTVLASAGRALLIQACPQTGRKHQIRAHLAGRGLPILGDALYGGPRSVGGVSVPRPMLHAWRLELQHPHSDRPLFFEAPLPGDFSRLGDQLGVLGVWRAPESGK
jgi:23S rRNA pseudouridine1911/1915/1917 synthase